MFASLFANQARAHLKSGYGEINYRDRAMIVTILLAIVVILRLVQVVLAIASLRRKAAKPTFFVTSRSLSPAAQLTNSSRRAEFAA